MSEKKKSTSPAAKNNEATVTRYTTVNNEPLKALKLDQSAGFKPQKSRAEIYKEMVEGEAILDVDVYEYATPLQRGIGLAIDLIFMTTSYIIIFALTPYTVKLVQTIFGKYHMQMMFSPAMNFYVVLGITLFLAAFFFIVIPSAFFNRTIGKKIMGTNVRSDNQYSMTISQAFSRELIFKPISIVCLAGFILPFFDKKKKSLHDKLADTFVIQQ